MSIIAARLSSPDVTSICCDRDCAFVKLVSYDLHYIYINEAELAIFKSISHQYSMYRLFLLLFYVSIYLLWYTTFYILNCMNIYTYILCTIFDIRSERIKLHIIYVLMFLMCFPNRSFYKYEMERKNKKFKQI